MRPGESVMDPTSPWSDVINLDLGTSGVWVRNTCQKRLSEHPPDPRHVTIEAMQVHGEEIQLSWSAVSCTRGSDGFRRAWAKEWGR